MSTDSTLDPSFQELSFDARSMGSPALSSTLWMPVDARQDAPGFALNYTGHQWLARLNLALSKPVDLPEPLTDS
jgi:hypothetical protein